jgi:mannitol-1-/sugar-/sorbitol-6-phosphatase
MVTASRELATEARKTTAMDPLVVLPCRAVLLDSDGVLVDSEKTVARSWSRWALRYGLEPDEVAPLVHGRRSVDTVRMLIAPELRAEARQLIDTYELEDAAEVRGVAGAAALVRSLPEARRAVVTSGTSALARARLQSAGVSIPEVVVTADDVSRGKPDPEGYLTAARRLEVSPETAVVVEDSGSGVDAARRAGVAAVVGVSSRALATDADVVVTDLTCVAWTGSGLSVSGAGVLRPARRPTARR